MKRISVLISCLLLFNIINTLFAEKQSKIIIGNKTEIPLSLYNEALHSIRIGLKWLESKQNKEGYWSNSNFPAVTALATWCFLRSPDVKIKNRVIKETTTVKKAINYILSCIQKDGGIYKNVHGRKGGGLKNYNTAICLAVLADTRNPKYAETIYKARQFLMNSQHLGDDKFYGGMGYDAQTNRAYADLSNTYFSIEAMRLSEYIELSDTIKKLKKLRKKTNKRESFNWDAAVKFISRCQNLPDYNDQKWATNDPDEKGGFVYKPGSSKAGEYRDEEGSKRLHSYGSITYAGVLSLLYSKLKKDDPRVQSAYKWITKHYTLEENPRMGKQSLYYYYNTMAKSLSAYGEDTLIVEGRKKINWRIELIKKLISIQKIDPDTSLGYWVNDVGRFWENDPVLATSYAILALEIALR